MTAQLHSIDVAADRLGLGRSATKDLIYNGRLRSVRIGKRRLIPEAAIAEFIAMLELEQATDESARAK